MNNKNRSNKRKIILIIILFLGLCVIIFPTNAKAACNFYASETTSNKNVNWSTSCTVATIEGADNANNVESLTSNSASLTLLTGGAVTINSTGSLVLGSLSLSGGNTAIQQGGSIQLGAPLYVSDADADGWPGSFTFYSATASGKRRLGLMKSYSTADCNDNLYDAASPSLTTWYRDVDGDGYGTSSTTTSACTQPAGYVANSTDCADGSANAYPGSTTCSSNSFTNNSGQASWDWDCSQTGILNGGTVCGTDLTHSPTAVFVQGSEGIGSCNRNNADCRSSSKNTWNAAVIACGANGKTCLGSGVVGGSCGSCGTTNGGATKCISVSATSAQTCK